MANYYYIRINNLDVRYTPGRTVVKKSSSAPMELNFLLKQRYDATLPQVGAPVQLFLKNDFLYFNGTIDSIDTSQMDRTSSMLQIPVKCMGRDTRLYNRLTYNPATKVCARYRSTSSVVNTSGTSVTWVSGDKFSQDFMRPHLGRSIAINDVDYTLTSVDSPNHITLSTSAGTQSGVGCEFRVWSGKAVKELLDVYCDNEGFVYDSGGTTIQDGVKVQALVFSPPTSAKDGIDQIVKLNQGFAFSLNPSGVAYFAPWTIRSSPKDFTDSTDAWKRDITISRTREDVRNVEVSRLSSNSFTEVTDTITGDGATQEWFLTNPVGEMKSVTLNSVPVDKIGNETATEQDYYYQTGDTAFWQDPAGAVLSSSDVLIVTYLAMDSDLSEYKDSASITSRQSIEGSGSGRYEQYIDRSNFPQASDALADAQASVGRLKSNLTNCTLVTKDLGYDVGQVVNFNVANNVLNEQLFIDEIEASDRDSVGLGWMYYVLTMVSISRRITANDVLRSLFDSSSSGLSGGSSSGQSSGGGVVGPTTVLVSKISLVDPTQEVPSPSVPVDGQILVVRLTQTRLSGTQITWASDYTATTPVDISMDQDSITTFTFVGIDSKWFMIGVVA